MKSPEVVQQLRKYQSRRRNQFLLRCQASRHNEKKSCPPDRDHYSESVRQASTEKPIDVSCSHSVAFSINSTLSDSVQPVIMNAAVTSVIEPAYSCGNEIWSKSDSAFTSFVNISSSQNAMWLCNVHDSYVIPVQYLYSLWNLYQCNGMLNHNSISQSTYCQYLVADMVMLTGISPSSLWLL